MLVRIIHKISELEQKQLEKSGFKNILFARIYSFASLSLCVYLTSILLTVIIIQLLLYFKYQVSRDQPYWWSLISLLAFPTLIPFLTYFNKRNINYSEKFVNIIEITKSSLPSFFTLKFLFESLAIILYVYINTYLTALVMDNFIKDTSLLKIILSLKSNVILTIILVHIVIYLTLRILVLSEQTIKERYIKAKRKFSLWILASLATLVYIIYKIVTSSNQIVDFIYLTFALFISIDRVINSYKELRKSIKELIEEYIFLLSRLLNIKDYS